MELLARLLATFGTALWARILFFGLCIFGCMVLEGFRLPFEMVHSFLITPPMLELFACEFLEIAFLAALWALKDTLVDLPVPEVLEPFAEVLLFITLPTAMGAHEFALAIDQLPICF